MTIQGRTPVFSAKLVVGLSIIFFGLVLLADRLQWYDAWHLLDWWPLVLAAIGLARLAQDGPLSLRGHVWLALALAGSLAQFGPWGLLDRWWPVFVVWGGTVVTLRAIFPQPKVAAAQTASPGAPLSCDPEPPSDQVNP